MSIATNILPLIPQRPPFVMVDSLETCNDEGAATTFTIKQDTIFVEGGILREPALIENIAQAAAARIGYICQQENKPVPVGFIGAVQNLKIHNLPKTGDVLITNINIKNNIFNATIIEGEVKANNQIIATCEMRIFISNV